MNKNVTEIGVDSGTIVVADGSMIENTEHKTLYKTFEVMNGEYNVNVLIKNTWNGDVETLGTLKVTTGRVVVTDPCYVIKDENWDKFLKQIYTEKTWKKRQNVLDKKGIVLCDNMGGDGMYDVNVLLVRK